LIERTRKSRCRERDQKSLEPRAEFSGISPATTTWKALLFIALGSSYEIQGIIKRQGEKKRDGWYGTTNSRDKNRGEMVDWNKETQEEGITAFPMRLGMIRRAAPMRNGKRDGEIIYIHDGLGYLKGT